MAPRTSLNVSAENTNNKKHISADGEETSSPTSLDSAAAISPDPSSKRRENASKLAAGYTKSKRRGEIASITVFAIMIIYAFVFRCAGQFFGSASESPSSFKHGIILQIAYIAIASATGIVSADFISGIIHWMADTWGTVETPFVGQTFIRSFREHHVAPTAMCQHDIIETNGDNCLIAIFLLAPALFVQSPLLMWYFSFLGLYAALTNQIHKWSHTYRTGPIVAFLQEWNIILSKKDHAVHHRAPHDTYYCITTGWLNAPLLYIGFFKKLEAFVTLVSGSYPRTDDLKWIDIKPGKSH